MPTASELEGHREALNALCARMLGSGSDADDAVQEAGLLQEDAGFRLPSAQDAWAIRFRCWRGCLGKEKEKQKEA